MATFVVARVKAGTRPAPTALTNRFGHTQIVCKGDWEMANPMAVIMMALGTVLLLFGIFLVVKRIKIAGIVISLLGLGIAAIPWLISLFLSQSGL